MIVAIASLVTIFNSFTAYNQQVTKASNSNLQAADTQLSVTGGQFGAFPPSSPSNSNVVTGCSTTSTFPTNRAKLYSTANMWWEFFTCNGAYQYSTSFDGVTWQTPRSIPGVITAGYTVGPDFDVEIIGTTIYLAIAKVGAADFQLGVGTLAYGGTNSAPAGTISWTYPPAQVATTANAIGPIQMGIDTAGNIWVEVHQGATAVAVYEREACATTGSNYGWEPNACGSNTAPTNYAPAALGALSANAHTVMFPAISAFSAAGVILMYETGSATSPSTGTLAVVTQTNLASTAWNTITLTGITDYSLTSSSADMIGSTMYFAGLANAAAGQTTGTLKFWTLTFTTMAAATNTAEQTIEGTTLAWQAGLAISGTTLVIFDNPSTVAGYTCPCLRYYSSSTFGSIWNSPGIVLDSLGQDASQTAVDSLCPGDGAFAVTWENTAGSIRFAAPSTFTLTNNSPFGVHVVDLYVYNPATNTLVAHWYYNTTEDFDYWVGQGGTTTVPVRFVWAADTSYLITFSTDTGVTAQTTLTSLPSGVSCPSGNFFSELSPAVECSPAKSSTAPYTISGAGANTCTDATSGTPLMMGFGLAYTTSASTSGNLYLSFAFQINSPATSAITSTWQLYYGAGASPNCGDAATGTALGQAYTVRSQAAVVRGLSQSVGVTLSGLAPSTTYWFDVQASDSSGAAWIYSNPDMALIDVQTTDSPNLTTSTNTHTCTDTTSGAARMMGFGTTFTTGAAGFSGNMYGKLTFNEAGPATSGVSIQYTVVYGTGAAPACNGAFTGTAYGNTYTVTSQAAVASGAGQKAGFVISGLSPSTTYWVDVEALDSSGAAWVFSNPTLAVMEAPTPTTNLLPAIGTDSNANTCTITTANTYKMAGFGLTYNLPSSAVGDLFVTVTFQVSSPATSGVNTQWQIAWGTGVGSLCNTPGSGTTVGNTYKLTSQSTTAGGLSQSETFVLQNVEKVAGAAIWVDVEAADSTSANWRYSQAEMSVAEFPA